MPKIPYSLTLFATALAFFAVFAPMGNLPSDTEYSVATAESIVRRGSTAIDPSPRLRFLVKGIDGRSYSNYGIGFALLFTPIVALSDVAGHLLPINKSYFEQFLLSFFGTFCASYIVLLFFLIFTELGFSKKTSLLSLAAIASASILLPYSKIVHAEMPTTVLLLWFILWVAKNRRLDLSGGLLYGLTASFLFLLKPGNVCYSLIIAMYGIGLFSKKKGTVGGLCALLGCGLGAMAFIFAFNALRFGDPFNTGYGAEQWQFTTPLLTGAAGLLFSPSKSLILFSPLVIPCLLALPRFYKKYPSMSLIIIAMALSNLFFYAKWHDWPGGWSWGPRLIVPSIILIHLVFPEFVGSFFKRSRAYRYLLAVLILVGFVINLLGALVWYQQMYHFHHDYASVAYSHPVIAAKLFLNKIQNRPEVYSCKDFGIACSANDYERIFSVTVRNDSLDFSKFEKFQGLATMWDGVRRNFRAPFAVLLPFLLAALVVAGWRKLWNTFCLL
jgi:hypothetical protein